MKVSRAQAGVSSTHTTEPRVNNVVKNFVVSNVQSFLLSGPTSKVTLMKAVDELVWADSQMLGCRGIFTVGLLQPLEFDVAVRGPKTG